jgi:hypothetical protein
VSHRLSTLPSLDRKHGGQSDPRTCPCRSASNLVRVICEGEPWPHCATRVGWNERPKSALCYAVSSFQHPDVVRSRTAPAGICCAAAANACEKRGGHLQRRRMPPRRVRRIGGRGGLVFSTHARDLREGRRRRGRRAASARCGEQILSLRRSSICPVNDGSRRGKGNDGGAETSAP